MMLVDRRAAPLAKGLARSDYALLQSWQKDDENGYVIASRSVVSEAIPAVPNVRRGAALPSGFLLEPVHAHADASVPATPGRHGASTRLIYLAQITPSKRVTGIGMLHSRMRREAAALMVRRFVALQVRLHAPGGQQEMGGEQAQAAGAGLEL